MGGLLHWAFPRYSGQSWPSICILGFPRVGIRRVLGDHSTFDYFSHHCAAVYISNADKSGFLYNMWSFNGPIVEFQPGAGGPALPANSPDPHPPPTLTFHGSSHTPAESTARTLLSTHVLSVHVVKGEVVHPTITLLYCLPLPPIYPFP